MTGAQTAISGELVEYIWRYRGLNVHYHPGIDGDGTYLAPSYVRFIREYFPRDSHFPSVFEWCAGPAFIGFALVAEGLCDRLCIADINPLAVEYARKTIRSAGLQKRVTTYVSDNLSNIPKEEKFDLVVGNPPGFFAINPHHQDFFRLKRDVKANDADWQIRAKFYDQIRTYLNPGAHVLIGEVEPHNEKVYIPKEAPVPRDIRPYPPIRAFQEMIRTAGLRYLGEERIHIEDQVETWMVISKFEATKAG
jgi:predicted RNA methylase